MSCNDKTDNDFNDTQDASKNFLKVIPKVMSPIFSFLPKTPETEVDSMKVEFEPSHQFIIDSNKRSVCQNNFCHETAECFWLIAELQLMDKRW